MSIEHTCDECMYFKEKPKDINGYGECRRYAPRPIAYILTDDNMHEPYDVTWPEVDGRLDWCGEFKAAE